MNDAQLQDRPAVVWPTPLGTPMPFLDPSVENPDEQFDYLTQMIEYDDAAKPSPYTSTPPWGEPVETDEYLSDAILEENYLPLADLDPAANVDLDSVIDDYFPPDYPAPEWQNDDQYHGFGVPPGIGNLDQPVETGHSQIILPNPGAEQGWDAWSGRAPMARVARMGNDFPGYSADVHRRMGDYPVEKLYAPLVFQTQQRRDLLLAEINRRGLHGVIVQNVPSVTYTQEVQGIDPTALTPEPEIGPEGVLP